MLHMLQWLYIFVANICFSCFTWFSVCYNRCCSPCALTHGHARVARTYPALPISVMQVCSNSWTRNGRLVPKWQSTPWSKYIRAFIAWRTPNGHRTRRPAPPGLVPLGGACSWGQHGYTRCAPSLFLACSWTGPTHMLSRTGAAATCSWCSSSTRKPSSNNRHEARSTRAGAAARRCVGIRTHASVQTSGRTGAHTSC